MSQRAVAWGRAFDPDRLALLELRASKAYCRGQPVQLFALRSACRRTLSLPAG